MGNISVLYLCNHQQSCGGAPSCGLYCKHTSKNGTAANPETVKLFEKFMETFEIDILENHTVRFVEKEAPKNA